MYSRLFTWYFYFINVIVKKIIEKNSNVTHQNYLDPEYIQLNELIYS